MEWVLLLVLSVSGDIQTTEIPFRSNILCERALKQVKESPPSMGGNAWWIGQPTSLTGEPTAQNHEILLRGAYCLETGNQ